MTKRTVPILAILFSLALPAAATAHKGLTSLSVARGSAAIQRLMPEVPPTNCERLSRTAILCHFIVPESANAENEDPGTDAFIAIARLHIREQRIVSRLPAFGDRITERV